VKINKSGRYLFIARPGQKGMSLCEIQVTAMGFGAVKKTSKA
jgi:hypothetical protein